jgi:2-polyprenyl-3-methyl-5-hydroxy-6-metoxy-1,4-benzoquinol methylase
VLPATKPHDYSRRFEVERLKVIQRCVDRMPSEDKSLIEFGCNAGVMTERFSRAFDSVVAIDYDADLVRQAAQRPNAGNVECMQFDLNNDLPERFHGRFDAAIALEVIEHLDSPTRFIQQIKRCLRRDGRLLISAPNMCSPEAAMGRFLGARDGIKYTAWDETHVSLFGAGRFVNLLRRNGLEITRLTGYYYGFVVPKIRTNVRLHWSTRVWPFNRFGFDAIVEASLSGAGTPRRNE